MDRWCQSSQKIIAFCEFGLQSTKYKQSQSRYWQLHVTIHSLK
uniref:CSON006400 protein n=1 Tax=Culicoides sonorensis TaxID=179676 RepID=A0A336MWB1_CULSO